MSMSSNMYEQLRAVWRTKNEDQPFVRGFLKIINSTSHPLNGTLSSEETEIEVLDRWFTLLGHSLFYCTHKESEDFSGALLTDLFSPVIARVDEKTQESFQATATQQPYNLYLRGELTRDVNVLLCPTSAEEKRTWLDKLQEAGLKVPQRKSSNKQNRLIDDRKKVVIIGGSENSTFWESLISPNRKVWKHQWQVAARKVLSLPDAAQIRVKYEILRRLVANEEHYCDDLNALVNTYLKQFQVGAASGHMGISRTKLDAIFLNCESLLTFHMVLLSQMRAAMCRPNSNFGEVFLSFIPHMNIYVEFFKSQGLHLKVLDECLLNPSFTDFLENHHSSRDCEAQHLKQLLQQPAGRLELYLAFLEEVLKQTSEHHCDYFSLGTGLQEIEDLKKTLSTQVSNYERQDRMLGIIESVGVRGFVLLDPDCELVLEDEMYLPASTKRVTGTIKQKKIYCYLYTTALVVIGMEKKGKNRSQIFPLSDAAVYEHVSKSGEVTYAKNPEVEIRGLKLYSPNGPRNGIVLIFLTQSNKSLWLSKFSEMISFSSPLSSSPQPPDVSRRGSAHTPSSQSQTLLSQRRSSLNAILGAKSGISPGDYAPNIADLHPKLSNSVMNLSTLETTSKSQSDFPALKSLDLLKFSHSNFSNRYVLPRSFSMLSVNEEKTKVPERLSSSLQQKSTKVLKYYSIPNLFSFLMANPPSPNYLDTFLLTYRMFTNAHEVLDALIDEHHKGIDERTSYRVSFSLSSESLRFFNTLRMWVNKYYVDFHHDVTLKSVLVVYLDSIKNHNFVHPRESELSDGILRTVNARGHIPLIRKSKLKIEFPRALNSIPDSLLSISAEELARQLTWIEHEIYSRIKPYEFLQQKWTKKNRQELAPNICYVISRFNEMTLWLTKEILSPDYPKKRCDVIQHLIQTTKQCLEIGNFVTAFQITSALSSSAIQRLKKTWDYLPHFLWEAFQELKALTTVEGGSKIYRLRQMRLSSPSPSVPYIGPYLNQLVSIEVGMPTFVKDPPEHVNFHKLTKLADVIEEVTRFQNPKYNILPDGAILLFLERQLESSKEFDEEKRYSRSIEIEPKKEQRSRKMSLSKLLATDD